MLRSRHRKKRLLFLKVGAGVLILGILVYPGINRAQVSLFYPTSCLGDWSNPWRASGKPDGSTSRSTSAVLDDDVPDGDLFCGSFEGEIPEDTVAMRAVLHIAWHMGDDDTHVESVSTGSSDVASETDTNEAIENVATSSVSSSETVLETDMVTDEEVVDATAEIGTTSEEYDEQNILEETDSPDEEDVVEEQAMDETETPVEENNDSGVSKESESAQESEPTDPEPVAYQTQGQKSFVSEWFQAKTVFAQTDEGLANDEEPEMEIEEDATSTKSSTTTPEDTIDETTPVVEIRYTFDGDKWISLGTVNQREWRNRSFDLFIEDWDSITNLQVVVQGLGTHVPVSIDGMSVEVEYGDAIERTTNPVFTDVPPALKPERTARPIFDPRSLHTCSIEPFSQTVRRGDGTVEYPVTLVPTSPTALRTLTLGEMPVGVRGRIVNGDTLTPAINLSVSDTAQTGSYTLVLVYDEKTPKGSLPNFCQFNLVIE